MEKLLLRKWEIAELVAIYDKIEREGILDARWLRATLLVMADGVGKVIDELPYGSYEAERMRRWLVAIRDQAMKAVKKSVKKGRS